MVKKKINNIFKQDNLPLFEDMFNSCENRIDGIFRLEATDNELNKNPNKKEIEWKISVVGLSSDQHFEITKDEKVHRFSGITFKEALTKLFLYLNNN